MPRGQRISKDTVQEVMRLREQRMPVCEISERMGIGYSTIYNMIARASVGANEERFKRFEKPTLEPGKWYSFYERKKEGSGKYVRIRELKRRMRFIKAYRWHALFEDRNGIRRCYQWMDVISMLKRGG